MPLSSLSQNCLINDTRRHLYVQRDRLRYFALAWTCATLLFVASCSTTLIARLARWSKRCTLTTTAKHGLSIRSVLHAVAWLTEKITCILYLLESSFCCLHKVKRKVLKYISWLQVRIVLWHLIVESLIIIQDLIWSFPFCVSAAAEKRKRIKVLESLLFVLLFICGHPRWVVNLPCLFIA